MYLCTQKLKTKKMITMKRLILFLSAMLFCSCSADNEAKAKTPTMDKIYITIGGQTQSATLVDNEATRELIAALQDASITVTLNDNDFEIWGSLGRSLTTKNEQMTVQPGDIVLYNGSNICIFYASNSWSYTRLGHIDNATVEQLKSFLKAGKGTVSVTLSVGDVSAVSAVQKRDDSAAGTGYSVTGARVSPSHKGVYIRNGKKFVK